MPSENTKYFSETYSKDKAQDNDNSGKLKSKHLSNTNEGAGNDNDADNGDAGKQMPKPGGLIYLWERKKNNITFMNLHVNFCENT